jgi:hypothetical protein
MKTMGFGMRFRLGVLISVSGLSCGAPEPGSEPVASERSEIVNGINASQATTQFYGMVAVYHPTAGFTWSPRPCSATIINAEFGFTWILTARHCVTTDGTIVGPIAAPSNLRVLPGPNPGLANPNPPAAAVTAAAVLSMGAQVGDMAVIGVAKNWEALVPRFGMWHSATKPLADSQVQFTAFGYGLNVFDAGCFGNPSVTTGAGVARYGSAFTITSGELVTENQPAATYSYLNRSTGFHSTICGDSGGGDVAFLGAAQGSTWMHLLGVRSGGSNSPDGFATTQTSVRWLQDQFGGFFLSPDQVGAVPRGSLTGANANLTKTDTGDGLKMVVAPTVADRWFYDSVTQRISFPLDNVCLAPSGGIGSAVVPRTCADVPTQRWTFGVDRRLVNVALGSCLTTATIPITAACNSSPTQMWAFHMQPYDFETYVHCANENQTCSFSGTKNVRYGANGSYAYRTLTNGAACNNATFGDPAPGVAKKCSIGPKGFSFCAGQNGTCTFSGQKRLVAYGANNSFYYRVFSNSAPCTVGAFGGDPIVGVQKHCYLGG